ncbi:MAG TPA: DUF2231 domain-containing protein [Candidatus Binataceae bacterium]|nr:DUF2231 domain-containing protein [Candidatus Binataceae bacterium]
METLIGEYHLHPIIDHFTIALCSAGLLMDLVAYVLETLARGRNTISGELRDRLSKAAVLLLIPGALSAICSRLTGESEAERVWDSISSAAQQVLLPENGWRWFFSHAVLGTYLMYALAIVAVWRVLLELWTKSEITRKAYLMLAVAVLCAVVYQGRTGGELVYNYGVGVVGLKR